MHLFTQGTYLMGILKITKSKNGVILEETEIDTSKKEPEKDGKRKAPKKNSKTK